MPTALQIPKFSTQEIEEARKAIPAASSAIPKFSAEDIARARRAVPETGVAGKVGIGIRSLLEGHTAGLSEPVISGAKAALKSGRQEFRAPYGVMSEGEIGEAVQSPEYQKAYREDVELRRNEKARYPVIDVSAQVTGGLIPSPANVGAKVIKGTEAALKGAKYIQGAGILKAGARGGITGAASGAGYEAIRQAAERPSGFTDERGVGESVLNAAKWGGGLGAGLSALAAAPASMKEAGKRFLSSKFGVSEGAIGEYLKNSKAINEAPSIEQLHDRVYETVKKISDDYQNAKFTRNEAEKAFVALKNDIKLKLTEQNKDAKEAAKEASTLLKAAEDRAKQELAIRLPSDVGALKSDVSKGSEAAFQILEKAKQTFPNKTLKRQITLGIQSLKVGGKEGGAVGSADAAAVASLERLRTQVDNLPEKIPAKDLKRIVQSLDRDISWTDNTGTFLDPASAQKTQIRKWIDGYLKRQFPEYAQAMEGVAQDTKLLGKVAYEFGTREHALGGLQAINRQTKTPSKEALAAFGKRMGKDYVGAITPENMPEFGELTLSQARVKQMAQPGWQAKEVSRLAERSPEASALKNAIQGLSRSEEAYLPFKSISPNEAGQTAIQSKLNTVLGERNIEAQRMFETLGKLANEDFAKQINFLRTRRAFEKADFGGSKNVNFWGAMGAIAGSTMGVKGSLGGIGVGIALGKYMDRYGPQTAKTILDQVIRIKGSPTLQKISKLDLSPDVKEDLARELRLIYSREPKGPTSKVAIEDTEEKREPAQESSMQRRMEKLKDS